MTGALFLYYGTNKLCSCLSMSVYVLFYCKVKAYYNNRLRRAIIINLLALDWSEKAFLILEEWCSIKVWHVSFRILWVVIPHVSTQSSYQYKLTRMDFKQGYEFVAPEIELVSVHCCDRTWLSLAAQHMQSINLPINQNLYQSK